MIAIGVSNRVEKLPRGGVVVPTTAGRVQFGIPPETVKDSLELAATLKRPPAEVVPATFVVPHQPFDRQRGVNVAEFEFPSYYNYFILGRKIRLVVEDAGIEARLRTVMQESLFGPSSWSTMEEYPKGFPADGRPDFERETDYFRRGPGGVRTTVDMLVEFVRFDEGLARLDPDVEIRIERGGLTPGEYRVFECGREVGTVPAEVELPDRESTAEISGDPFVPPEFGVTVLGSSHGFDPKGKTTGFVLWIGGRGVLVDPPVGTTNYMRMHSVTTKLIDGVILTHCHADHDSGTFQKLIEEGRVNLYTTPTIAGSFLRKYSALSGIGLDLLQKTFAFRPVTLEQPMRIHGALVRFFYTLHSIPTIGFEASYGGKTLAFSADTLYDPERIRAMQADGVISQRRHDDLIGFPWKNDVVLHEAGVPPLHTPTAALAALPEDVKTRLYLVHIAAKDLPGGQGLKVAPTGVDRTIRIEVATPRHAQAVSLLEAVHAVDLFRDLPLSSAREFLQVARERSYPAGTRIIERRTSGEVFYVVVSGEVTVVREGESIKSYRAGDYFGETALVLGTPRNADVIARTDVALIEIDRTDFLYVLRGTGIEQRLERLAALREERSWEVIQMNSFLGALSSGQKTQLQSCLEVQPFVDGDFLWKAGETGYNAFLLDQGEVLLEDGPAPATFSTGAFLGEIDAIRSRQPLKTSARAVSDGRAFKLGGENLRLFFETNPGLLVSFYGATFVE